MGGRAAEEVVFGSITTGAAQDIESATNIARSMITRYGMSDKFGLVALETVESRYLDKRAVMNCADNTAADVDKEIVAIIAECYEEAKKIMLENRDILDKIAAYLIEKENITGKEFMEIYCKEKGIPLPEPKNPSEKKGIDVTVSDDTKTSEEVEKESEEKKEETSETAEAAESTETVEKTEISENEEIEEIEETSEDNKEAETEDKETESEEKEELSEE